MDDSLSAFSITFFSSQFPSLEQKCSLVFLSSICEIAAIHVLQRNLRQDGGMVWNFTGERVCVSAGV